MRVDGARAPDPWFGEAAHGGEGGERVRGCCGDRARRRPRRGAHGRQGRRQCAGGDMSRHGAVRVRRPAGPQHRYDARWSAGPQSGHEARAAHKREGRRRGTSRASGGEVEGRSGDADRRAHMAVRGKQSGGLHLTEERNVADGNG
ncbi:hypothetical protein ACP4OV_031452 [Aristida adscensionis]